MGNDDRAGGALRYASPVRACKKNLDSFQTTHQTTHRSTFVTSYSWIVLDDSTILGVHGLAAELGVPVRWVLAELDAGHLPYIRLGRRSLFDVRAVKLALAQRVTRQSEHFTGEPTCA